MAFKFSHTAGPLLYLLIGQSVHAVHDKFGFGPLLLSLFGLFVYLSTNFRVDIHTGNFLKDFGFLVVLTVEETGELALSQHRGTTELAEVETYSNLQLASYFGILSQSGSRIKILQFPNLVLYRAGYLLIRTSHSPCSLVAHTVAAQERQSYMSLGCVSAHKLARVVNLHLPFSIDGGSLHLCAV